MPADLEKAFVPDAENHPPASTVTPTQIEAAAEKVRSLQREKASRAQIAAAEVEQQALCDQQNSQLREIYLQKQIGGLLPKS